MNTSSSFLVIFIISYAYCQSQGVANVTLVWSGGGPLCNCPYIQADTFACNYGDRGYWNEGKKNFTAPMPMSSIVTSVDITLFGTFDCDVSSPNATFSLTFNEIIIYSGTLEPNLPCFCANCVQSQTIPTITGINGIGQENSFQIFVEANTLCMSYVEIVFTYSHASKGPNIIIVFAFIGGALMLFGIGIGIGIGCRYKKRAGYSAIQPHLPIQPQHVQNNDDAQVTNISNFQTEKIFSYAPMLGWVGSGNIEPATLTWDYKGSGNQSQVNTEQSIMNAEDTDDIHNTLPEKELYSAQGDKNDYN